jgi:membrane-associated phospholipid phosphatase
MREPMANGLARMSIDWVSAAALVFSLTFPMASAHATPRDERVPITANFPVWELVGIGGVTLWYGAFVALQRPIVRAVIGDPTARDCGGCLIGAPTALDRAISDALYRGPTASPLLARIPDHLGAIGPAVAGAFYLQDAVLQWTTGRGVTGSRNADHELVALLEAFMTAMAINQTVKIFTGRLRPFYQLERGPSLAPPPDTTLSFFSGHSTASFVLAAFVYRDVSDWLVSRPLSRASFGTRVVLGRVLPAFGFYGVATLVGVSRIVDQAHYFSDVALGAAVGTIVGNVVYAVHFDDIGRPRDRRRRGAARVDFLAMPGSIGIAGSF